MSNKLWHDQLPRSGSKLDNKKAMTPLQLTLAVEGLLQISEKASMIAEENSKLTANIASELADLARNCGKLMPILKNLDQRIEALEERSTEDEPL
jgi:hypothetical protein